MEAQLKSCRTFNFGPYHVDVAAGQLWKDRTKVRLAGHPFEILVMLLERAGQVVTREEIQQRLWPGEAFGDFENSLNKAINKLRQALADSAEQPAYVETLPRRGYRFIASIQKNPMRGDVVPMPGRGLGFHDKFDESSGAGVAEEKREIALSKRVFQRSRNSIVWLILVAILAASGAFAWWRSFGNRPHRYAPPVIVPLASLPGEESMPAFSPDGSRVAFAWQTPQPEKSGIYAVIVGTQSLVRLSNDPTDVCPAWSPDGRYVAFLRYSGDKFFIELVPALGGQERRIYTGERSRRLDGPDGLSFSPDGRLLALSERNVTSEQTSIRLLSLDDSRIWSVTAPPEGYHDWRPAFSPDGQRLVFVRSTGPAFVDDLFVTPVNGGDPARLTFDERRMYSPPSWTPDGKELVFSSNRSGLPTLWRISASGGRPEPVLGLGPVATYPTISLRHELAYEHTIHEEKLWQLHLQNATHSRGPATVLTSSKTSNILPQFSPDGRKIAFQTDRSGYPEIWICDADGSNAVKVTGLERFAGSPRWSPDGHFLAFDYRQSQHSEIYVVDVHGSSPQRVTTFPGADNVIPSWSRDGRWIYFASNQGKKSFQLWRVPANGGVPLQVTKDGGFAAFESFDGRFVFYTKRSQRGIWKVPRDGGPETAVLQEPGPDLWSNWAVTARGIYFVDSGKGPHPTVQFLDFATSEIHTISNLEMPAFFGFDVSPDGATIIYSQEDRNEHDIMLLKNFR
jgi:Tol biopolymer transport system component/DNA-binding winged helix-turn-helix (wHTH) protein